jgi:hypothetical protein
MKLPDLASLKRAWVVSLLLAGLAQHARADEPLEYNRDIRPILADNCFACHGADSAARKADLRLDQRDAAIEYGAIAEGKPEESALVDRIFADDPEAVMPPPETKKKLTAAQKEKLKQWIAAGAEYQPHWSFIPPTRPEPPAVKNEDWVKTPIDRFVLAKLEEKRLSPAAEADPYTLFRRLHLDTTGLPPSPEDAAEFVSDYAADKEMALSAWIDRLMNSSAWGEHRGRYWLDAARYGDTHGMHFDNYREMWPYRDWVIRAFNANQPFDQFTIEQLAGDMLPSPTVDQLVATGFQRCNITTNEGGTIDEENLANYAADRVQTFGWVYLGLTTNCAQCHDHKFDPFTMKDYYSLAAFFRNTTQGPKDGNVKDGLGPVLVLPSATDAPRWNALPGEIAANEKRRDQRKRKARGEFDTWLASVRPESLDTDGPSEGLIAHLPLNEGAGNEVKNLCQCCETFKAAGEVTWVTDGKLGPAPVIGSESTFDLGDWGDFEVDQKFSYGAWIKPGEKSNNAGIIARMDEKAGFRGWDLFHSNRGLAVHIVDTWPERAIKVSTRPRVVKPDQWQHVMVTYNGSGKAAGVKIYIDGKEEKLTIDKNAFPSGGTIRTKAPLRIGQRTGGKVFEGGAVQDVRVYSRMLTAGEVKALADIASLREVLAKPAEERKPPQIAALYNYYLESRDARYREISKALADLESEQEAIKARSPLTHIQQERKDSPAMAHMLIRGAYDKPGDQVEAATPAALHPLAEGLPSNRLGLAKWLIDPANPLTARVAVNRFWQEIFGQGIVATPEDFGVMGALPSHPELLDWLAVEFRESGWNVKQLFNLILLSATYRQAAVITPAKLEKDHDNILLSRGPRFRMDAEMVRDNALAASGLLSPTMYGPSTKPYQPEGIWDIVGLPNGNTREYVPDTGENLYRRTLYTFWKRMAPPPNLEAFNAPSREVCTVRRERTNTPLQALVTLNDPQFVTAALQLAQHALRAGDDEQALDYIARRVLCRPLKASERAIIQSSKDDLLAYYSSKPEDAKALVASGESKLDRCQLAAWTMVCNQIMNLDEVLNK